MSVFFEKWRRVDTVAVVIIVCVLIALLIQPAEWVSDGALRLPVRVFVFDAVHCLPISNADCLVFRSPPAFDPGTLNDHYPSTSPISEWPEECRGITDATGFSVIDHTFSTSGSHEHPAHAHLMNVWVRVEAFGFGGVVVPVGNDERRTSELRKEGQILISIGLIPQK